MPVWCRGNTAAFQAVGTGSIPAIRSTGGWVPRVHFLLFSCCDGPERREVPCSSKETADRLAAAGGEDITDCHGLRARRPRVWPPYKNRRVIGAIGSAPGS